ncbi:restriction endonuclease [Desulfallas thermosapovorans]|uniref:Restriction endonuclease n=1 Tax=Desulfallas thermosapovorans DSM 6562 TaxID=1121431 RepID=A0A5S4ZQU4_9FIRM|nr:restriction endonuclease [Desulfallas thermosapovorans]TYO94986.1 restriction endonuclease [Desulfallas thermosapovorans DSM 6562]
MFSNNLRHYMQNPPRDERTRLARAVDFILILSFTWVITFFFAQLFPQGITSQTILIIVMAIEAIALAKIKNYRHKALNTHRDIWYSARKCRQNIKNINNREEFILLVKDLLEGIASFEKLQPLSHCADSSIDMTGYMRNYKTAVMCINSSGENDKVSADKIKAFLQEVRLAHFQKGIVVTTGSYTDEARRLVRRMHGRVKIHLIDGYKLLHMAKRTNHPIFPAEKWQEEKDTRITGIEMALSIKENMINSKKKSLLFVLLGLMFLVIATVQTGFISTNYVIFGVINLFTGLTGFILSLLHKDELIIN